MLLLTVSSGSLAIGVLIPYNDQNLLQAIAKSEPGAAASPWVIAIKRANIAALPTIINAVILTSATSSGNAFLYTGSRYLYALAQTKQAPRFFLKCSKAGVPYYCVLLTWAIGFLTFMSVSSGSAKAFTWFQNLTTISTLFTWVMICFSYVRFHNAMKAQGVPRSDMPFRVKANDKSPILGYIAGIFFALIIFFNGWDTIAGGFDYQGFITDYIGVPICKVPFVACVDPLLTVLPVFALYLIGKIFLKSKWVPSSEADLFTGKAALDAIEWPERVPRNMLEKVWFWIA